MKQNQQRMDEISIYSKIPLNKELMDRRIGFNGLRFGLLKDVCRQYGIKYEILNNCIKYTAPKSRLQMFVEKLHFSLTPYSESQY